MYIYIYMPLISAFGALCVTREESDEQKRLEQVTIYIYIYIYMHTYIHAHTHIYIYTYIYIYLSIYLSISISISISIHLYIYIYNIHIYLYIALIFAFGALCVAREKSDDQKRLEHVTSAPPVSTAMVIHTSPGLTLNPWG